ncbi:MAG: hypothetical protein ACE5HS_12925 [bacterium]
MASFKLEDSLPHFGLAGAAALSEGASSAGFAEGKEGSAYEQYKWDPKKKTSVPTGEFTKYYSQWAYRDSKAIQLDQPWTVDFKWTDEGDFCPLISGNYTPRIYLEQMGKGEFDDSLLPAPSKVKFEIGGSAFTGKNHDYSHTVSIPANTVTDPGVYRLVATLTFAGPTGKPAPIAAFADFGLVQFYKA